jgi:hypothetical protein
MASKSPSVVLTVAAAMGIAAHGQQGADPCDAATFNAKVCKTAVRHNGYCAGGVWVPMTYQQHYPYYYDSFQQYQSGGNLASPALDGNCKRPSTGFFGVHGASRGGFGSTGAGHHAGG